MHFHHSSSSKIAFRKGLNLWYNQHMILDGNRFYTIGSYIMEFYEDLSYINSMTSTIMTSRLIMKFQLMRFLYPPGFYSFCFINGFVPISYSKSVRLCKEFSMPKSYFDSNIRTMWCIIYFMSNIGAPGFSEGFLGFDIGLLLDSGTKSRL